MYQIKLKELRESNKLSQRSLASLSDVPNSVIERIEAGEGNPTIRTLVKIALALDVGLDDLVIMERRM